MPLVGDPIETLAGPDQGSGQGRLHGGMLFEELGFRYMGPIDGHNIAQLVASI